MHFGHDKQNNQNFSLRLSDNEVQRSNFFSDIFSSEDKCKPELTVLFGQKTVI